MVPSARNVRSIFFCAFLAVLLCACATAQNVRQQKVIRVPHSTTVRGLIFADCGRSGFNNGEPPAQFVRHVTFCEGDPYSSAEYMQSLRLAGLPYASFYTDTWFNPYCAPPFSEPAGSCRHAPGSLVPYRPAAWLHDAAGERLHRLYGKDYQVALNTLDPGLDAAISREMDGFLAGPCTLCNMFESDDSGTDFARGWYGFSARFPVEVSTPSTFALAHARQFNAYPKPIYFNGVGSGFDFDGPDSHGLLEQWLHDAQIIGAESEGCWDPKLQLWQWIGEQHAVAFVVGKSSKYLFCLNYASETPAERIYSTASLWMAYKPGQTVMWKEDAKSPDRTPTGHVISGPFREDEILPLYPRSTGPIERMRSGTGVFVREFSGCYWSAKPGVDRAGQLIGPCAAIVNPTDDVLPMPVAGSYYRHSLVLDDHTVFAGGTAKFTGRVPVSLASKSAVILGP